MVSLLASPITYYQSSRFDRGTERTLTLQANVEDKRSVRRSRSRLGGGEQFFLCDAPFGAEALVRVDFVHDVDDGVRRGLDSGEGRGLGREEAVYCLERRHRRG